MAQHSNAYLKNSRGGSRLSLVCFCRYFHMKSELDGHGGINPLSFLLRKRKQVTGNFSPDKRAKFRKIAIKKNI